jgi:hypothetical protein
MTGIVAASQRLGATQAGLIVARGRSGEKDGAIPIELNEACADAMQKFGRGEGYEAIRAGDDDPIDRAISPAEAVRHHALFDGKRRAVVVGSNMHRSVRDDEISAINADARIVARERQHAVFDAAVKGIVRIHAAPQSPQTSTMTAILKEVASINQ